MDCNTIGCVKAATKILGDKWTPQLMRFFLNEETLRFCQIQDCVEGINPRTLSARLIFLEKEGIITKNTTKSSAQSPNANTSRCEYTITEKGKQLAPVIRDMEHWSQYYSYSAASATK